MQVYDTTLRDGAQREGITYSVVDKLAVARLLDQFGVAFIEGGWPGAMPKDTEFFRRARTELSLRHAVLVAFGATREAGAEAAVMCDTNGGMLPSRITHVTGEVGQRLSVRFGVSPADAVARLGIHCQNDTSCAVANTIAAVEAGVPHFQCTANGYGERPGNADLFAVVANLQLKLGMPVLPDGCVEQMVRVSHAIAEIANIAPDTHQAYVGFPAFAHKAGLHASAIKVDPLLYNHVEPAIVGN